MSRTDFEAAYIERYGHRPRGWNDDFQVYQDAHANGAWFGWQARAAGIEAKAAPVGEREAFETYLNDCVKHGIEPSPAGAFVFAYQAGAAHQRQQAREVVMPERQEPDDEWHYVMRERSHGWNACLDEFARLNKGAGSHE